MVKDDGLEGEAAREDARDDATMAFARESTAIGEGDDKWRFEIPVLRLGGSEGCTSEAETNESSEEA